MTRDWPFPGDSPIARARKIALAYRAELLLANPGAAERIDRNVVRWGERWAVPGVTPAPTAYVTAIEAGDILGVAAATVSACRVKGLIAGRRDGRRYEYLVSDVHKLAATLRTRRPRRPRTSSVTVGATGSTVDIARNPS